MSKNSPRSPIHDVNDTVSMSECTGLMPAALDEGGTNLGELLAVHPPEAPTGARPRSGRLGAKNAAVKSLKL